GTLAADVRLERKVRSGWKWRLGRKHQFRRTGVGAARRLRDGFNRHGAQVGGDTGWVVRARPSGKTDRLRLSGDPRNDREVEGHHYRVLRPGTPPVLLERLLQRWPAGSDGG